MSSGQAPVLPTAPAQPVQAVVIPQTAMQIAPNVLQPMPGSGLQNVFVLPVQYAPFAEGFAHKQALFLGCVQIIIGILCIILQCVAIGTEITMYFVGQGIWCGLFFILAGAFGVASGTKKRRCLAITFMVLSILSAALCLVGALVPSAIGLALTEDWTYGYRYDGTTKIYEVARMRQISYSVNGILVFLAIAEFVIVIWSAAICCGGVCCRKKIQFTGNIQYTAGAYPQDLMINQQAGQIPMQVVPQGMPGQQQFTQPLVNAAGEEHEYEELDWSPTRGGYFCMS